MKQGKRFLLMLLAVLCLMTTMLPISGSADVRKYSVRFFGGNKGSIVGGNPDPVPATGTVAFPSVTVDEGYYLKGFVEGGKDTRNFESVPGSVSMSALQRDIDYVAVYGIKGTEVKYTVQYLLNGTSTKLAPDGTFYAGVGDRPISSYIYIEGYQPYLRSTKTLVADESQNVLFCYYTAIPTGGGGGAAAAGGGAAVAGGGAAVAAGAAGAANPAGAGNAANPAGAGNAANPAGAGNAANPAGGTTAPAAPQYQQTEDILDLDVPLAAPEFNTASGKPAVNAPKQIEPTQRSPLPSWALIAGAVVLVGLISMLYWYLLFYRKRKRFEEYDFSVFDEK